MGKDQLTGGLSMIDWDERESDYIDWEVKYGKEEAILIASEEWGISTYQVETKVKEWDNRLWQ